MALALFVFSLIMIHESLEVGGKNQHVIVAWKGVSRAGQLHHGLQLRMNFTQRVIHYV